MKKTLLLAALLALSGTITVNAQEGCPMGQGGFPPHPGGCKPPCMDQPCCKKHPPKINIDEKLKLTDKQKEQAKQLRAQGREQMEPIMNAIRIKFEQKELLKKSTDITTEAKLEQIEKLDNQIFVLKKQAHDLRLKNERDFEAILTSKQKKELDKIKSDVRKNMEKQRANSKKSTPTKQ